ncbi:MAG TPA: AAA family ATPase [Candidatus Saccharimonadales bacterium]|nr:AAA family ATPase [Candidatus Saccharimonadales bacterium]
MKLLFHPTTQLLLDTLRLKLPQAILLNGPKGSGLFSAAHYLAQERPLLILQPKNARGETDEKTGTITIESIRDLYEQTRTKSRTKRIVIIDGAERMSHGAQSAFLKLLEEPNNTTHFILTSHLPDTLLPTIRSRTQALQILPLTTEQSKMLIQQFDIRNDTKETQLLFLANGLPAELTRLTHDEAYFKQQATIVTDAREFITSDTYHKLLLIQKYRTNREEALNFIDSIMTILRFTLNSKPQHKLIDQLDKLLIARERIAANGSIPLQFAQAVL